MWENVLDSPHDSFEPLIPSLRNYATGTINFLPTDYSQ